MSDTFTHDCPLCGIPIFDGIISVVITQFKVRPKSHTKAQCACPWAPTKPDLDNVAKTVLDALNGIVYVDDSRVCQLFQTKSYDTTPRIVVEVTEIYSGAGLFKTSKKKVIK